MTTQNPEIYYCEARDGKPIENGKDTSYTEVFLSVRGGPADSRWEMVHNIVDVKPFQFNSSGEKTVPMDNLVLGMNFFQVREHSSALPISQWSVNVKEVTEVEGFEGFEDSGYPAFELGKAYRLTSGLLITTLQMGQGFLPKIIVMGWGPIWGVHILTVPNGGMIRVTFPHDKVKEIEAVVYCSPIRPDPVSIYDAAGLRLAVLPAPIGANPPEVITYTAPAGRFIKYLDVPTSHPNGFTAVDNIKWSDSTITQMSSSADENGVSVALPPTTV